ncbi:type III restriction enzyme, res subunit domain-containing protein [Sarocladium implicatum]|nr:type III restriction enzyme, res subunit domain-containing protein [Sarocladium implicatum]
MLEDTTNFPQSIQTLSDSTLNDLGHEATSSSSCTTTIEKAQVPGIQQTIVNSEQGTTCNQKSTASEQEEPGRDHDNRPQEPSLPKLAAFDKSSVPVMSNTGDADEASTESTMPFQSRGSSGLPQQNSDADATLQHAKKDPEGDTVRLSDVPAALTSVEDHIHLIKTEDCENTQTAADIDDVTDAESIATISDDSDAGSDYSMEDKSDSDDSDSEERSKNAEAAPGDNGARRTQARTPRECVKREVAKYLMERMAKKRKTQANINPAAKLRKVSCHRHVSKADKSQKGNDVTTEGNEADGGMASSTEMGTEMGTEPSNKESDFNPVKSFELDELDFDAKRMLSQRGQRGVQSSRKIFGYNQSKIVDDQLKLANLKSALRTKQVFAVHWMIKQEEIAIGIRGGILAADMGTGKTVMSLALIASNMPDKDDKKEFSGATLVVVPNHTVAQQWYKETHNHCRSVISDQTVMFNKAVAHTPRFYQKHTIVIATYGDLRSRCPSREVISTRDARWNDRKWRKKVETTDSEACLFSVGWYRVILDEGHKVRNMETLTFDSTSKLKAKYRWCLTGTPLANTDEELFSYLTFLCCDFARNRSTFYEKFKREYEGVLEKKEGLRPNVDALVQSLMFRLPSDLNVISAGQEEIVVPFADEEKIILHRAKFGTAPGINMRRQMVSSFTSLDGTMIRRCTNLGDLRHELESLENQPSALDLLLRRASKDPALSKFGVGFQMIQELQCDMIGGHFNFIPFVEALMDEQGFRSAKCLKCENKPEPMGMKCAQPECNSVLVFGAPPNNLAMLDFMARSMKLPSLGRDYLHLDVRPHRKEYPASLWGDSGRCPLPTSSKLTMAMAILLTWRREHPADKIIVFFAFRAPARQLGQMLSKAREAFIYKFGCMGDRRGKTALNTFRSSPSVPILVAGLECCAEALNLTEANRVLLVDLGWNRMKEDQAFARVHRLGQQKQTHFVRLVSEGDQRTVDIQREKLDLTDYPMGRDGHKIKKLSREQLNSVFAPDTMPKQEESEDDGPFPTRRSQKLARRKRKRTLSSAIVGEEASENELE